MVFCGGVLTPPLPSAFTGIISCLDFSPDDSNLVATGSYSSVAAVYDAASGSPAYILSGHKGGLTQVLPWTLSESVVLILHNGWVMLCCVVLRYTFARQDQDPSNQLSLG